MPSSGDTTVAQSSSINKLNDTYLEVGDRLIDTVSKVKRVTVANACDRCRSRKVKCDGQRPCAPCTKRALPCAFAAASDETLKEARKRKHEEVLDSRDHLQELHDILANGTEEEVHEIIQRTRDGQRADVIVSKVKHRRLHVQSHLLGRVHQQRLRRQHLLALITSTAPLATIVDQANLVIGAYTRIDVPQSTAYDPVRDRLLELAPRSDLAREQQYLTQNRDGMENEPPIWVPAEPWVSITRSDEAVSHLVSLFLRYINPYWRVLEADAFLRSMRSRKSSQFCSSFLVHVVLAMASMFSEIDEAFAAETDLLTRGLHFHVEAIKLWHLEGGKSSVANIQGAVLMSLQTSMRGQDKSGWNFLKTAAEMNKTLALPDTPENRRISASVTHLVVFVSCTHTHTTLRPFYMCPASPDSGLPELDSILSDTTVYWDGYPSHRQPLPFRQNRLMFARHKIIRFLWDGITLLLPGDASHWNADLGEKVKAMCDDYHVWWTSLAQDFADTSNVPIPVFELHAQFYEAHMCICNRVIDAMAKYPRLHNSELQHEFRIQRLRCGHQAAKMIADLRSTYGFKILPLTIFQVCAVALSTFLLEMALPSTEHAGELEEVRHIFDQRHIDSSFEECFRCLLAAGMNQLLPRVVARVVYHEARELQVRLPVAVQQMLRLVADTAWNVSDLHNLNAAYSSYAVSDATSGRTNDFALEDLLRKWEQLEVKENAVFADMAHQSEVANDTNGHIDDSSE